MPSPRSLPVGLVTCLVLALTPSTAALGQATGVGVEPRAGVPPAQAVSSHDDPLSSQVGRELARLDERLDLGTFPDGSPLWPARLAASIERLTAPDAQAISGLELLRSLAEDLRSLGADQPLIGPPDAPPSPGNDPATARRNERLRHLLATARLLERKLDRPGSAADHVAPRSAPANDDCASATAIGTGTFTGTTIGATNDGASSCGSSSSSPDVWYRYSATADGSVTFDTYGSSFDTVLSLHSACPGAGTELGCSDDAGGTAQSALSLDMTNGEEVWIRVSGFGGSAGSYTLHVAQTGGLSGTVTRLDTGAPLAGATVTIYNGYGNYLTETHTESDGSYEVDGLALGTYYARAHSDGVIDQLYDGFNCPFYLYCNADYDGTPISVGQSVSAGIDFALAPGGSISGVLTETSTGDPLSGYVYLYSQSGGNYLTSVKSGADGSYALSGLPPGKYYLKAQASNHRTEIYDDVPCSSSCDVTSGTLVPVTVGSTVSGIDFALDRLGAIEGVVTDEGTSDPVSSLRLDLYDSAGSYQGLAYSTSTGAYEFQGLLPGTYFVRTHSSSYDRRYRDELYDDISCETGCTVTTGTPIAVSLAATTSGIDFALVPEGKISGSVTEAGTGTPIASLRLLFFDSSGYYFDDTFTMSDGTYVSPGLPSGTYYVATGSSSDFRNEVYDDVACAGTCNPTAGTPISVALDTTTSGIDFALVRNGRIAGTVTDLGSGSPIAGIALRFYDANGYYQASTSTASDGTYLSPGVPAGTYFAYTNVYSAYQNELYDQLPCTGSCVPTAGTPIVVSLATTTPGIDFALQRLGSIEGHVTAADTGYPLYAYVYVLDAVGNQVSWNYTRSGAFDFQSLPAGSYYLKAVYRDSPDNYEDAVYPAVPCEPSCTLSQGSPVSVALGTTVVGVNFALSRCSLDSFAELAGIEVVGSYTAEACERVSATATTVRSGAAVTFRSGREIVLGDGFEVETGASFQAIVDPSIVQP